MRVLITASGIQDYIFNISHRAASARLRGRSARLGLVLDRCLVRITDAFEGKFEIKRNAGSRLELEFSLTDGEAAQFLQDLQRDLDEHSLRDLDGQVWFAVASAEGNQEVHGRLAQAKLQMGQSALQSKKGSGAGAWNEEKFVFQRRVNERGIEKEEASKLPEALLGRDLAHEINKYIYFCAPNGQSGIKVLDAVAKSSPDDPARGFRLALTVVERSADPRLIRKRLARFAPLSEDHSRLLDLDEIADRSTGAKFLGALKADLDNLGSTFAAFRPDEEGERHARELSDKLDKLFTEDLESLLKAPRFASCYVVYSGGDDLFLLGPWDQLLRFIDDFQRQVRSSVEAWGHRQLTLSAGFKLVHPKSPIRYLAEDANVALATAKRHCHRDEKVPHKSSVCIFERVLSWDEVREGLTWADQFVEGAKAQNLSIGFLQRLQYYADQFRQFFDEHKIDGLRAVPLLQNDWRRNTDTIEGPLKLKLANEVQPLLTDLADKSAAMWRMIDFASRCAIYLLRQKE
jgi:CRISPR-associated protein Csm1